MNVVVSNKNKGLLASLDIDVIKSIEGEFTAEEIIQSFSNFFYNRMFLDITAVKNYTDISNIQKLSIGLEMDKVIVLLDNTLMSNNDYISKLISVGIYNFANSKESLIYLYNHPNTYKDVAHMHKINVSPDASNTKKEKFFNISNNKEKTQIQAVRTAKVIGFKNVTLSAGATTLIYMLKKAISDDSYVVALEVNKNDFSYFNEKDMYSVSKSNLEAAINRFDTANYILVDLNNATPELCDETIYLMEPSIIKLNKMITYNSDIFDKLYGKKIILNKSNLSTQDIKEFEFEAHSTITYNIPQLNDRADNGELLRDFFAKINQK